MRFHRRSMRVRGAAGATPRRILAVKLSSFGDLVHVTPCLRALRIAFPEADIRVAVERRWADVLRALPYVDGVIEASARTRLGPSYLREVRRALAASPGRFDVAIDFQGTRRSALWVYASGARVMTGRGWPRPLWLHALRPDLARHAVEVCADVCRTVAPVADLAPELRTLPADEACVARVLDEAGAPRSGFVLLNPFSRWDAKGLDVATAAALAVRVARLAGDRVVVSGGPDDVARAGALVRLAGDAHAVPVAGALTLAQALCLFRRARLMVTCDSGPMHAAAALGTPVVALFGPTHPERTGPWGAGHVVVQALRPLEHHAYRTDHARRHMSALTVDAMVDAVATALARTDDRRRTPGHADAAPAGGASREEAR